MKLFVIKTLSYIFWSNKSSLNDIQQWFNALIMISDIYDQADKISQPWFRLPWKFVSIWLIFSMYTVQKFLYCIKLKQGCKFIGWFGITYSLLLSLAFIGLLIFDLDDVVDYINNNFPIRKSNELPLACEILIQFRSRRAFNFENSIINLYQFVFSAINKLSLRCLLS